MYSSLSHISPRVKKKKNDNGLIVLQIKSLNVVSYQQIRMNFSTTVKTTLQKTKGRHRVFSFTLHEVPPSFQADTRKSNPCASKCDKISRFLSLTAGETGTWLRARKGIVGVGQCAAGMTQRKVMQITDVDTCAPFENQGWNMEFSVFRQGSEKLQKWFLSHNKAEHHIQTYIINFLVHLQNTFTCTRLERFNKRSSVIMNLCWVI